MAHYWGHCLNMPIPGVIASEWRLTGPLTLVTSHINTALYVGDTQSYGYVSATGGTTNYSYSSTSLPAGLTLNAGTGIIGGTLTAGVGNYTVTFTVTDLSTSFTKSGNVTFVVGPALSLSFTGGQSLSVGTAYAGGTLTATGGSGGYTYSLVAGYSLPSGLSLTGNSITGTPTTATPSTVTSKFKVTDSDGNVAQTGNITWSIVITLTVTTSSGNNPTIYDGATLGSISATGGTAPYTYSYTGNFPNGITGVTSSTGAINGTVVAGIGGTFSPLAKATDSLSNTGSQTITYTVVPIAPSAVTGVAATRASSTSVNLTWTLPTTTNNIASITITSSPSITLSYSVTPSSTSATVTGSFVLGQAYTFTVTTNNSAGSASSLASNSVNPAASTLTVNYIVVGGGGGGGWYTGGGAGQVVTGSGTVTLGSPISISTGAGGTYIGGQNGGNAGSATVVTGGIVSTAGGGNGGASGSSGTGNKGSGGSSGNGYTGGAGASYRGGGGAGAGGNGTAGTGTTTGNSVGGNGGAFWGTYYIVPQFSSIGYTFAIGYGGEGHGTAGNGNGNGTNGSYGGGGGWEQSGTGGEVILYWSAADYPGTPTYTGTQYIGTDGSGNAVYMWGSGSSGSSSGTITF